MSLIDDVLQPLALRIGQEVKAVRSEILPGVPTFIQQTEPVVTGPAIWYETDGSGNIISKHIQVS